VAVISNGFHNRVITWREMSSAFFVPFNPRRSYREQTPGARKKLNSPLFETARVLVHLNHVASFNVNANHSVM
jgi:hypothetical protein